MSEGDISGECFPACQSANKPEPKWQSFSVVLELRVQLAIAKDPEKRKHFEAAVMQFMGEVAAMVDKSDVKKFLVDP
ncbi:MAG TPA: hypothetical protein VGO57_08520 [Verrucomicrobiae bacterium]